jgi:hypothetical protein
MEMSASCGVVKHRTMMKIMISTMKFNTMYVGEIISRFMDEDDMAVFHKKYKKELMRRGPKGARATKHDFDMYHQYKSGEATISELAQKYGISYSRARDGIIRASVELL